MTREHRDNTRVFVPGFNSRPVVEALLAAGMNPVPLDHFGDVDLLAMVPGGHYYTPGGPSTVTGFPAWVVSTLRRVAGVTRPGTVKPLVLPCSGFDDIIEAWHSFHQVGSVLGNQPPVVQLARNINRVRTIVERAATGLGFLPSVQWVIDSPAALEAFAREVVSSIPFPAVIKPVPGGGGAGIEHVANEGMFHGWVDHLRGLLEVGPEYARAVTAQQRVDGTSLVNASILACNDTVACLTAQVIGEPGLHAPAPFSYCGNIVPFSSVHPGLDWLDIVARRVTRCLHVDAGLTGLYGIDIVVAGGEAWFMEINPRVPGSLEPAMLALDRNIIVDHVKSFRSRVPSIEPPFVPFFQGIKHVLFAPGDFTMPTLESLVLVGKVKDITPPGTRVRRGDPVVTYILKGPLNDPARNARLASIEVSTVYRVLAGDEP